MCRLEVNLSRQMQPANDRLNDEYAVTANKVVSLVLGEHFYNHQDARAITASFV